MEEGIPVYPKRQTKDLKFYAHNNKLSDLANTVRITLSIEISNITHDA